MASNGSYLLQKYWGRGALKGVERNTMNGICLISVYFGLFGKKEIYNVSTGTNIICKELPGLAFLNISHNIMAHDISGMPLLNNIRILVLNHTGISWKHVEILKDSFPFIEELHLVGNKLKEIAPSSSTFVKGFDSLHLLNLDDNCIDSWEEILKLSQLKSLEQLFLNHNNLSCIWYPDHGTLHETANGDECLGKGSKPFKNLHSLLLGNNKIKDVESVDSLNYFPNLLEVRLSENPVTDPVKSGLSRFVLVARLAGVKIINGSEAFTVRYWKASNILLTWFDFETLMQVCPISHV
nr:tubulin-folding cofactor E [Ipomoea batatas]